MGNPLNNDRFMNKMPVRIVVILTIITMNICFYLVPDFANSGAMYAINVGWWFFIMIQAIFLYAIIGLTVMAIKGW